MVAQLLESLRRGPGKVLLVGAGDRDDVQKDLTSLGWSVATVADGRQAVARAMREIFGVAVLLSTGEEMDLTETVLNLRDLSDSMSIVIVGDRAGTGKSVIAKLVHAVPNIEVLTLDGLLDLLESGSRQR